MFGLRTTYFCLLRITNFTNMTNNATKPIQHVHHVHVQHVQSQTASLIRNSCAVQLDARQQILRRQSSAQSSHFVQGVRHLQKLKEDENYCRDSWARGKFAILYDQKPVLVPLEQKLWGIPWKSAKELAEHLNDDFDVQESIVLNCSSADPTGPPKFAINIAAKPDPDHKMEIEQTFGGSVVNARKAFFVVSKTDARILSQCLALFQWHFRNQFCSGCGGKTVKDPSGAKRTCLSCSRVYYPVVSPVAIVLVTKGDSCLVVRQPKFLGGMYSAISGFFEPGESLDTAVRREVAEEVGLEVDEITFYSTQHWAFPMSSLMLGCHARLKPGTADQVTLDEAELEDSRWLHRDEVLEILNGGSPQGKDVWLPPSLAIAHHLLKSWASQGR